MGAACDETDDCTGAADSCLTKQTLSGFGVTSGGSVTYRDGYCTAACKAHADCGKDGKCPIGQAIAEASVPEQYRNAASQVLNTASYCYLPCTTASECRAGYQCNSIPAALTGDIARTVALEFVLSAITESSISTDKYCLPTAPPAGAGASDAGADGSP